MLYTLSINLSQNTVVSLNKGNYTLCCFLSNNSQNASQGEPLCWSITKDFLDSVQIEWNDTMLGAYVSSSPIEKNEIIYIPELTPLNSNNNKSATASIDSIQIKQRMVIEDYGMISIDTQNNNENILIQNDSTNQYTSGICVYNTNDDTNNGTCAFTIYGENNIQVAPVNSAFLMFSSRDVESNTVISVAENSGILIKFDMQNNSRTVSYDMNTGWSSNNQTWGIGYPQNTDLNSLLFTS